MNAINVIHPYKYHGSWVFDDAGVGLLKEPFVSGADTIIEHFASRIPDADEGFDLVFSGHAFPGRDVEFDWVREESGGNWYRLAEPPMEGWLCPAFFEYFEEAPPRLFAQFLPKKP
jgi:hypothetical protein